MILFGKDIRHMVDAELSAAIKTLIENREPESLRLDYKETLDIRKDTGKKELAKDVSSFANEQGGILIYGVPEVRDGELPRPKPLAECGMEIDPGLPESIERILIPTVQPPLHALAIRVVDLPEIAPKQLLIIQHPESYWKPHMIEGYGVRRYYRRVNYRAIKMTEREVEAAHLAREASRRHAKEFLDTASFGSYEGIVVRAVACPVVPGRFKDTLLQPGVTAWLSQNQPVPLDLPPAGRWQPFLDGWRFLGWPAPQFSIVGSGYEIRVFHNGAICLNLDADHTCVYTGGYLDLDRLRSMLSDLFLRYSGRVLSALGVNGPLVIQITVRNAKGLKCVRDEDEFERLGYARKNIENGHLATFNNRTYGTSDELKELERPYVDGDEIVFEEESCVADITDELTDVEDRLMRRLKTAFGLWG